MLLERMALRGKIEAMKTDGKLVEREKKDVWTSKCAKFSREFRLNEHRHHTVRNVLCFQRGDSSAEWCLSVTIDSL